MRTLSILLILGMAVIGFTGCGEEDDADGGTSDTSEDSEDTDNENGSGVGGDVTFTADSGQDFVAGNAAGLFASGTNDWQWDVHVEGPVTGMTVYSCDGGQDVVSASTGYVWDWDTYNSADEKFTGYTGTQTWVLGVVQNGELINEADTSISLGAGTHDLELYAEPGGDASGEMFCIRVDGENGDFETFGPVNG